MEGYPPPKDRFLTGNRPAQSLSEFSMSEHLGVWQTADAGIPDRMKETSSICQQQEETSCSGAWGLALFLSLGMNLWSLMEPQIVSVTLCVHISLCILSPSLCVSQSSSMGHLCPCVSRHVYLCLSLHVIFCVSPFLLHSPLLPSLFPFS